VQRKKTNQSLSVRKAITPVTAHPICALTVDVKGITPVAVNAGSKKRNNNNNNITGASAQCSI
jgi:hypothetical protein